MENELNYISFYKKKKKKDIKRLWQPVLKPTSSRQAAGSAGICETPLFQRQARRKVLQLTVSLCQNGVQEESRIRLWSRCWEFPLWYGTVHTVYCQLMTQMTLIFLVILFINVLIMCILFDTGVINCWRTSSQPAVFPVFLSARLEKATIDWWNL